MSTAQKKPNTGYAISWWLALLVAVAFGFMHLGQAWILTPTRQTVKVIAVDYKRSEYTATTKDPSAGWIKFTAPCAYGHKDMCPSLGLHKPDETAGLTEHEISISQPEER
jgi:hypothetical protein